MIQSGAIAADVTARHVLLARPAAVTVTETAGMTGAGTDVMTAETDAIVTTFGLGDNDTWGCFGSPIC